MKKEIEISTCSNMFQILFTRNRNDNGEHFVLLGYIKGK